MKFKRLKLYTKHLELELNFYSKVLGFKLLNQSRESFSVQIGWSELAFEKSEIECNYHYCFLVPSNLLNEALAWMVKRVDIIEIEKDRKIQNFESWNADSFYFYDASGNLVEFIARYDLKNSNESEFDISSVLGINEMGMPTKDVNKLNKQLEDELNTKFWKGDVTRFGTNGSQEGIWLLPNYEIKKNWFPTKLKIQPNRFDADVEVNNIEFGIEYKNEKLKTTANNI